MSNRSRINWSSQEDQMLKQLKEVQNIQNWTLIAENINRISLYTRNTKQCRQRYRSNVKCGRLAGSQEDGSSDNDMILKWTKEEQDMILDLYRRFNSKWVLYIPYFKNRSENNIKNRFYNTIKRNIIKINGIISASDPTKKGMKKNKKQLRFNQVTCLFELCKKIQQSILVQNIEDVGSSHCSSHHDYDQNSNFHHLDFIQVKNIFIEGCKFCMDEQSVWEFLRKFEKVEGVLGGIGIKRVKNKRFWKLDNRKFQYIITNNKLKNNKSPTSSHQHNNTQQTIIKYAQIPAQSGKNYQCPSIMSGGLEQKNKIEQDQTPEVKLLNIESDVAWIEKFNFELFDL